MVQDHLIPLSSFPRPFQSFVRNPYYCVVDTEGNQLPYVDRMLVNLMSPDMIGVAASNGELTMQIRHIGFDQYTLLMSQRELNKYEVRHWSGGGASSFAIYPNLNRKIDPRDLTTLLKHRLLNKKEFRQALSLALNRQKIIKAEFSGQAKAAQIAPSPQSPFYEPSLNHAFTQFDPIRANHLLDQLGLANYDTDDFRTFADGSRMLFFLDFTGTANMAIARHVVEDWGNLGIHVIARERARSLWNVEAHGLLHDFSVLGGPGVDFPLFRPKVFIPTDKGSFYALAYVKWYLGWGLYENSGVMSKGALEPPAGHPLRRALEFYEQAIILPELADRVESFREVLKIAAENVWVISVSIDQPSLAVVKKGFRNVPQNLVNSWDYLSPGNAGLETFYFQNPHDSPGAVALMKREIMQTHTQIETAGQMAGERETPSLGVGRLIRNVFFGIGIILVILVGARHPYVGRRLVIMIPTLFIISLISFIIIQLPPGDYLTSLTAQLEQSGELADEQKIEQIEEMFLLHESVIRRYSKWIGMRWFFTFEEGDKGLLQGYMGRSMETLGAVNDLVGDRILLTILISMGAILFT